ncbi:6,7-dimethyl-8-ribityllumazine synthase [Natronoglycomyces albus]|uniref:6,7-dimethyl-8-ribityllumazine synthase n=1 Tax=Natronoglycomyces albus TaxID=2811108 RepID=A0A895XWN2_9ACTN|nr:6,7-dimethyl-8-ribityllumazine synthase [Natronoglycomyces albus]QSB06630.1 6,7-dimethyl-8-ribityllumazine synthase [Natronoglycomyces albus]
MAGEGTPQLLAQDAQDLTLGIVATRWHAHLVDQMISRAQIAAHHAGIAQPQLVRVAGAVELPVVAQALARKHDAVLALGVVIRGGTAHFEYVCNSVTDGLTRIALDESTPVAHGVLTVDTVEQARDRAGFDGSAEDKGYEGVMAALDAAVAIRTVNA